MTAAVPGYMEGPSGRPPTGHEQPAALTRRGFLGLLAGAAVAACSATSPEDSPASASSTAPLRPTQPEGAPLPSTRRWRAGPGEVNPDVKARATRLIEVTGTWTAGAGSRSAARGRASAAGFDPDLVDSLAPLLGPQEAAAIQVRDAQYGGILAGSASVLVVTDQWRTHPGDTLLTGGTTVDVRLERATPHWRVVAVHPAQPGPVATHLSSAATRVLADTRIRLPHAAHADIEAGRINDTVLDLLSRTSDDFLVDVSVLRSGHPLLVFGTTRPSDHPRGRAVDVWALDGKPLVIPHNHPLATRVMRLAAAAGAYNIGGPLQLRGRQFFTDQTHHDHIHIGFTH